MQLTIYFDEKPVILCDQLTAEIEEMKHHPDAIFIDELSGPAINSLLHEIKKPEFHAGILLADDLQALKDAFFKHFKIIEAAGGIIQNDRKEILFIFRRGKWDLPKGKLEDNEDIEACAQREVEEETGVKELALKTKIGETYHTYNEFGKHILKISHWYHYTCSSAQQTQPQFEEDITEVRWFPTRDIKIPMSNTFLNIKKIMSQFFDTP